MASKIGVLISGASGKMGMQLQTLLAKNPQFFISALVGQKKTINDLSSPEKNKTQIVIDFSVPENTIRVAQWCADNKKSLLIGTTGFTEKEMKELEITLKSKIAWAWIPNTSLGVFVMKKTLELWTHYLNDSFEIYLEDIHHSQKRDTPSGTAKMLLAELNRLSSKKVEVYSMRGGSEVGLHRISFLGPGESLEIQHRATDRSVFAQGALRLALKLVKEKARKKAYSIDELFD
jgi:4-hydroxy-tetrahydrodipicolinate reductase